MVEGNLGIWGNDKCAQCGACCYEYYQYLSKISDNLVNEQCESFKVAGGKAYCLSHGEEMEPLCASFLCNELGPYYNNDRGERLRKIAVQLGTVPE